MTALAFSAGVGVQPLARRLGKPLAGVVAGLCCAAAGAGVGVAAVAAADRVLAGVAAVLLGLAYGLGALSGQAGAFGVLAGIAVVIAAWTAGYGLRRGRADRVPDPPVLCQAGRTGTRT
jgi:hypothetical protein